MNPKCLTAIFWLCLKVIVFLKYVHDGLFFRLYNKDENLRDVFLSEMWGCYWENMPDLHVYSSQFIFSVSALSSELTHTDRKHHICIMSSIITPMKTHLYFSSNDCVVTIMTRLKSPICCELLTFCVVSCFRLGLFLIGCCWLVIVADCSSDAATYSSSFVVSQMQLKLIS